MPLHALKDLDSTEGTALLHSEDGHLILHPRPNPNDPNDPLRWPTYKKYTCFTSVCFFAFMANYAIGGLAPAFYILSVEFHKTQKEVSNLLIYPILVLGVFNFLWVPLANHFGKRPVFVFTTLLLSVSYLWGALAQSFKSLLWSNIVAAFAGSASEALAASIVNDIFFLHQRANLMGWYMNAIAGGNTIGPLICGFVVTGTSWRVHKWVAFGLAAGNFLAVVGFVPETRYDRTGMNGPTSEGSNISSAEDVATTAIKAKDDDEKATVPPGLPTTPQIPKKSFLQEMRLFTRPPKNTSLLKLFLRPLPMIVYPAVVLAFLGFAVSLAWVVAINLLNSFVLQAPPYNWSPSINGLINIPGLIGNLFGAWMGGWVVDRYSDWQSRRNGGVFEPETRLHLLVVPGVIVPAGCLAFGYGVQRVENWTALFFGNGMVSVGLTAVPTILLTFASDSYLPVNADALTLAVGLKNVVAFGFLYGIVPWVTDSGYINTFGAQAGIYVAIMLLAVPFVIWGGKIRHATAQWRIIL